VTLLRRIYREKRSVIVPLVVGLIVNLAAYVLIVRPLAVRSATAVDRARTAADNLRTAERDLASARALVEGKTLAEQELSTFYDKILPSDLSAARRMTYAALPALARKTNVRYDASHSAIEAVKDQRLGRLRITMVLEGDYDSVRRFIYELETTPAFVIIDNVTLAQGEPDRPLALSLELSAYFRTPVNGN
jgi:type II secretion system (T2SS) protein M